MRPTEFVRESGELAVLRRMYDGGRWLPAKSSDGLEIAP